MGMIPPPITMKVEDWIVFYDKCESGWKPDGWDSWRRKFVEWMGHLMAHSDWFNYRIYLNVKVRKVNACTG